MAAPTSTNEVTARKLSSSISALWTKIKSTFQPVADRVTSWSSTPSDTKYPSEKLVKDSLDGIAGDYRTKLQDASKGGNLVVNGNGVLGTNYNFGARTFIGNTDLPNGNAGCFHAVANTIWHDEPIAVDVSKTYEAEVWYRVKSSNTSTVRFSACCFDVDGLEILAIYCTFGVGTLTELTQDLKPGDTVVHLADLSGDGWLSETNYHHGFIFWNYQNSLGYTYPQETYSRNVYPKGNVYLWDDSSAVNVAAGTITLKSAWNGPTIPAGTKVSRRNSSGNYYYVDYTQTASASTSWEKLSGKIFGTVVPGSASGGAFKPGTAFLKIGFYNSNTTTNEYIEFTGISLREIPGRLSTARKLKTNLARTADSTFDGSADQTNIPVTGTLPVGNGGTGATTAIGAEYNILNQVADIDTTLDVNRKIALCNQAKSASSGVFRWIKLNNVWTLFKGLLSSESGVNISGTASGLSSTLAVGRGGTGKASVTAGNYVVGAGTSAMVEKTPKEVGSNVLSSLDDKSNASSYADFVDGDFVVGSDHVDASTISASTFVRRTALNLWNYIKSKLSGSNVNIGGNAATAGTADTAKAYDTSFSGTNSIASKFGEKQNLVAWDLGADTYNASTNRAATVDSIVKRIAVKPDGFSASVDYTNAVELSIPYSAGPGRVALMCVATTGNGNTASFQATFVKNANEKLKFVVGTIMASTGTFVSPVLKFLSSDDSSPAQKVVLYIDANVRCNLSCLVAANDGMSSITVTEVARSTADNYSSLQSWGRLANDSGVVHIDGTETIIGAKEFSRPGQDTNFTDSSGAESIVRARTSSNSNNGSCQLNAYAGGGKFGVYARNAGGTGKWVACLDNDGVVNLGSSGDAVRIGGTKFVFGASQLGTESNTFYWV